MRKGKKKYSIGDFWRDFYLELLPKKFVSADPYQLFGCAMLNDSFTIFKVYMN